MIFASLNVSNFIERTFIAYIHSVVKFVNGFFFDWLIPVILLLDKK